jgi:hypothetical protein
MAEAPRPPLHIPATPMLELFCFQYINKGCDDSATACTQRMSQGHSSAIDIYLVGINAPT